MYVSVDGGGTKTEVCIYYPNSEKMQHLFFDGININQIGAHCFEQRIHEIFSCLHLAVNTKICLGVPGYGESSEIDRRIEAIIKSELGEADYFIINDVIMAHYASLGLKDGIIVLSGTGSMGMSISDNKMTRAGGWGYLLADKGSAFEIGLNALLHIADVFDGIEYPSILSDMISKELSVDFPNKLINYAYGSDNYRKDVAAVAQVVSRAAELGCDQANQILLESAQNLARYIRVLQKTNDDVVSYAGSVFKSKIFIELIEKNGEIKFSPPQLVPVLGGILKMICAHNSKVDKDCCTQELKEIYKNY